MRRATLTRRARYARLNWPTSCSSCSAVRASSCAEAAISCVDALVCCVEAETCSRGGRGLLGDGGDLGHVACTCAELDGDLLDGGRDLSDAAVHVLHRRAEREERLARLLDGGDAVLGAAGAVLDDLDGRGGPVLDLADEGGDRRGGAAGLLGELADLVGDDGEAAAVLAGAGGLDRGVQRQQVRLLGDAGDRGDDAADALGLLAEVADRARPPPGSPRARRPSPRDASVDRAGALARRPARAASAAAGRLAGVLGAERAGGRDLGGSRRAPARPRGPGARRPGRPRRRRSAISPTARPASSDVVAICCEAAETVPADAATSPMRAARRARLSL